MRIQKPKFIKKWHKPQHEVAKSLSLIVKNERVFGKSIAEIKQLLNRELDILCIMHQDKMQLCGVTDETMISDGDHILVSVNSEDVDAVEALIGVKS